MVNVREVWKDIKGFEGLYQVSDLGNVKSLDRKHSYFNKNTYVIRTIKGKMLKQPLDRYGYKKVVLLKEGKYHFFTAHRLVALNFIDNINNLPQVNHINNNREDNRVENLEWCTNKQNIQHGIKNGNIKLNDKKQTILFD